MPLRRVSDDEKRKARRGEFRTTKGKGTKDLRDRLKEITSKTRPPKPDIRKTLTDAFAGGIKGKPHSSPSGRAASVGRTIKRMGDYKGGGRAKYGIGSLVKKGISTILKPKGVFKPKPVPKAVTDVDRPFKGYDKSYTRADDKKITSMLKKLGDEIKAQPLPSKLKKTLKKAQKAFPHKKAAGGRIGLKHGGSVGAAKRGHGAEIK